MQFVEHAFLAGDPFLQQSFVQFTEHAFLAGAPFLQHPFLLHPVDAEHEVKLIAKIEKNNIFKNLFIVYFILLILIKPLKIFRGFIKLSVQTKIELKGELY